MQLASSYYLTLRGENTQCSPVSLQQCFYVSVLKSTPTHTPLKCRCLYSCCVGTRDVCLTPIGMSSKNYEENGYGLDLDLLIISLLIARAFNVLRDLGAELKLSSLEPLTLYNLLV